MVVKMGSPLAPVLPNLFMGHYEKECLTNCDGVLPSYYTRYVDDIFFQLSIRTMRQNGFFLILIQDTLILSLLWKHRSTKLFPFWMSLSFLDVLPFSIY